MEYLGFVLITLAAVVALYFAIARLLGNRPAYPAEIEAFSREHNRLVEDLKIEREAARRLGTEAGRLAARVETLERELNAKEQQRRAQQESLQAEVAQLQQNLSSTSESLSQATAQLQHSERANAEMKQFLAEAQSRLSNLFTEMASKAFDERSQQAERNLKSNTEQSRADIESLLKPYAERLGEFRQRLDVVHSEETQERASMLGAVRELKALNQDVAAQAAALTTVLKGGSKVRADWGDVMLESVLKSSGLIEGQHYLRNRFGAGELRTQPDVIITLPDERKIAIDCRLGLGAWQEAMNADTPAAQDDALRRHAQRVRDYIRDLSASNYPQQLGESALEISIAFVPIEAALSAALGSDPSLQADAFEGKVALASPNTLIALLAVVERLWVRDQIRQQAAAISAAGDKVLEALTPLLQVFEKTGKQLGLAHESFAEARRLLTESSQSLIPHARLLASLGADKGARLDALATETSLPTEAPGLKNSSWRA